ncbi:MAG: hypothetical protein V1729_03895 [Candidatus Woesearchaeota archaeon]
MAFSKYLEMSLKALRKEKKILGLIRRHVLEIRSSLEDAYTGAKEDNPKFGTMAESIKRHCRSKLIIIHRLASGLQAQNMKFTVGVTGIKGDMKAKPLNEVIPLVQDIESDMLRMKNFFDISKGSLSFIFRDKRLIGFDGSCSQLMRVIDDNIVHSTLDSMESDVDRVYGLLNGDIKVMHLLIGHGISTSERAAHMFRRHQYIIDTSFLVNVEKSKKGAADYRFDFDSDLVMLNKVDRECMRHIKNDLRAYVNGIAVRGDESEARPYLTNVENAWIVNHTAGKSINDFKKGADIWILAYAWAKSISKKPVLILSDDPADFAPVVEYMHDVEKLPVKLLGFKDIKTRKII